MARATHRRWPTIVTAGVVLVLAAHVVLRAWGLFGPPALRPLIVGSFLLLWPTPWLLLSADERRAIGFGRARAAKWWLIAFGSGLVAALTCFAVSLLLFGQTADNPFVSIRASFLSGATPPVGRLVLFLIFTGPALLFSPFGEEVFCRGVIYGRVRASGDGGSSRQLAGAFTSAAVFATIHLMHHGLVVADGVVGFRVASGATWFVMMFLTSLLFSGVRSAGASIWLAVASHAAFNLAMNAAIFAVFA